MSPNESSPEISKTDPADVAQSEIEASKQDAAVKDSLTTETAGDSTDSTPDPGTDGPGPEKNPDAPAPEPDPAIADLNAALEAQKADGDDASTRQKTALDPEPPPSETRAQKFDQQWPDFQGWFDRVQKVAQFDGRPIPEHSEPFRQAYRDRLSPSEAMDQYGLPKA